MTMNIDSSGMQWAGSIADFEEGTNASAPWGLNASAPVLGEVYQDNVDAGMAYGAESGGLEADGTEQSEDNMCSSEMSSALCEGIQTEIDRVFSNGIFSGCAGFWGFHFLALRELVGSERVRKARARCAEACDITHVGTRDGRDNSRGRASTFYV